MSDSSDSSAPGAPWHLWVVGVVSLLWNAMGAFDYVMTKTRNEDYLSGFTAEQLEFFQGLPSWVVTCWAVAVWGGLLGSLLLLLRRGSAVFVFGVSFLAMVATTVHNFGMADGYEVMGAAGAAFSAAIFVVALLLVLYARALRQRKVLC